MTSEDTPKRFHHTGTAYRFVHNTLGRHARFFEDRVRNQDNTGEREGISLNITAALIFTAFEVEANVNFVGWKRFDTAWPERASLKEKIDLLNHVLETGLDWGSRPLQSVNQLKSLRDTLAHGKPDVEDIDRIVEEEPDLWAGMKHNWEERITPDFLSRCREDSERLWVTLLEAAKILHWETTTRVQDELTAVGQA